MSFLMVEKNLIIVIYFLVTVLLQLIFSRYCFVTVFFIFQLQLTDSLFFQLIAISVTFTVNRNHTAFEYLITVIVP